jgi:drug/metabolite transporter (DMT)-like permease
VSARKAALAGGIPIGGLILLAALAVLWGTAWPINKIALAEIPLFAFRTVCLLAGTVALFGLAWMGGQPLGVPRRHWPRLALASLFNVGLWNLLVPLGILLLPAGRASVLFYTTPVWASLLAWLVLKERLSPRRLMAIGLGLAAIAILVGGDLEAALARPLGTLCILSGSILWAAGAVVMRGFPSTLSTMVLAAWQLALSLPPFLIGFLVLERDALRPISAAAWIALAYTVFIGFAFGYWAWFRLVRMLPVAVSTVSSLAIPIVAVLSSVWLTGERPGPTELAALALVAGAILSVALPERRG